MNVRIEEIENVWIPLADGCRLAARIWLPENARNRPVPALLEFLPYRKRDFMRARDEPMHRYFAENGYASVRVDLRGSGDSEGLLYDEYSSQELDDGVEVIAWLAGQSWCDGAVGMFGISWGGFNALQVAARQPPALKAIMSLCASDDRYADDAHYMGGCLLTENLQWGAIFMMNQALPPDPELSGSSWRARWRERLKELPNFPEIWMRRPWRDAYWREASVCEYIDRIRIPVYAIGGWADAYSNAVPRLLESLQVPAKGLVGPWAHTFPHLGIPGPAIGFLQEAVRWWDRWLKNEDNGIMDEPRYRVWMQDSVEPQPQYETMPGRWVAETEWPSPRIETRALYFGTADLTDSDHATEVRNVASPETCGIRGGEWCGFGSDGEMPRDQRPDDGFSLTFDSERLHERVEILGAPVVHLRLRSDKPVANVIVRLCDVSPHGSSLRVSYGILNLTHRDGHAAPRPLVPGEACDVTVKLNDIAHAFPAGHRIRVAVSTAYWPIVWPAPSRACLSVSAGKSRLELPVRPPLETDSGLRQFEAPETASSASMKRIRHHEFRRRLEVDLTTNRYHYELNGNEFSDASLVHFEDIDLRVGYTINKLFEICENDPLSALETIEQRATLARGEWRVTVRLLMTLTATADAFLLKGTLDAEEGTVPFATRDWDVSIPRRLL